VYCQDKRGICQKKKNIDSKSQTSWTSSPVAKLVSHPSSSFSMAVVREEKYVSYYNNICYALPLLELSREVCTEGNMSDMV
jgi:hypothetical protein